LIDSP
jgi:hypothetical protein